MNEEQAEKQPNKQKEFEAGQNWLGFWDLLIKVDRRLHPEYYKKEEPNG